MAVLRMAYRCVFVVLVILVGMVLTPLVQNGTMPRSGVSAATTSGWHRWLARALGIRIVTRGRPHDAATLYVANHISWFDILALGSLLPLRFLSKAEVKRWPVIGWLATRAGTFYIKRGAHGSMEAIAEMARALESDQNVCLFAEGTTTDGNTRKFHGRLIQSAIDAGSRVQPVAIYYPPADKADGAMAHPDILYTGDTSLGASLARMLRSRSITAEIHFLETIDSDGRTRDQLAARSEKAVRDRIEERYYGTD